MDHGHLMSAGSEALLGYEGKVGLLVRQHGEWIHHNAST